MLAQEQICCLEGDVDVCSSVIAAVQPGIEAHRDENERVEEDKVQVTAMVQLLRDDMRYRQRRFKEWLCGRVSIQQRV